jgi:hypothetical protein
MAGNLPRRRTMPHRTPVIWAWLRHGPTSGSAEYEGVTDTHIHAPNGMITHGLLTLSAITAQPFLSSW